MNKIKYVLVACEESQVVCMEFRKKGLIAFSCDIQPCSGNFPQYHIQRNVLDILTSSSEYNYIDFQTQDGMWHVVPKWDLIIAHPPCTMLCSTSSVALSKGQHSIDDIYSARKFFLEFYNLKNVRVCIENPKPMALSNLPPYSQVIQPYEFSCSSEDEFTKLTCLWLINLPPLLRSNFAPIGSRRNCCKSYVGTVCGSVQRSKTFKGVARAMATQWGDLLCV